MKIIDASKNDIKTIIDLKKSWYKEWKYDPPKGYYREYNHVLLGLIHSEPGCIKIVVEKDDVIGYSIGCSNLYNKSGICLDVSLDVGYLSETYVTPEYRHKGIAGDLLKRMLQYFKKKHKKSVFAIVYSWNDPIIGVFEKDDWELSGYTYTKKI